MSAYRGNLGVQTSQAKGKCITNRSLVSDTIIVTPQPDKGRSITYMVTYQSKHKHQTLIIQMILKVQGENLKYKRYEWLQK